MSEIKDAWEKARLAYQKRYAKDCEELKESLERDTEFYKGQHKGALLEMSWVLIGIFGLTGKQVDEVERNNGFTNADIKS